MKIDKTMFSDSEFLKADEKYRIAKHFDRFVKNGFKEKDFVNSIYEHLHIHCGFIAHYSRIGFYHTYFNGGDLRTFISHFLKIESLDYESYYNYCNVESGNYQDINKVIADILIENNIKEQVI